MADEPKVIHTLYKHEDKIGREIYYIHENGNVGFGYEYKENQEFLADPEIQGEIPAEVLDELLRHLHIHRGVPSASTFKPLVHMRSPRRIKSKLHKCEMCGKMKTHHHFHKDRSGCNSCLDEKG